PVELVIVRERVRVGPDHVSVNERGAFSGAAVRGGFFKSAQAFDNVGAVNFREVEVREILDELRYAAAWSVDLDGHGNGVAVVFHHKDDRQLFIRGGVERLPEFALRGRSVAQRGVDNLIALELNIAPLAVVAFM